jgi:hypothetical protein
VIKIGRNRQLAIKLTKYLGELPIKCEIKSCGNRGTYLLGESEESLSNQFILCEKCVKTVTQTAKRHLSDTAVQSNFTKKSTKTN